ncbi:HD domain-containing protein [Thiotrichales bacterium 19S11-10]|nr:HD domain-containing protein [Thiotrichales bacterium 19S11-10]
MNKHQNLKQEYLDIISSLKKEYFGQAFDYTKFMNNFVKKVDKLIINQVLSFNLSNISISLIALAGLGRKELYPFSDLDLLVLCNNQKEKDLLSEHFQFLWRLPIKVTISYRTLKEAQTDIINDLSFFTSLLNARHLFGEYELYDKLNVFIQQQPIKPVSFLKIQIKDHQEQLIKLTQNLEPDLKQYPNNLRTYHRLCWILSYFNCNLLSEEQELRLIDAHHNLAKLRIGLHLISGKNENNLYFNYQQALANALNLDKIQTLMSPYYQASLSLGFYFDFITQKLIEIDANYQIQPLTTSYDLLLDLLIKHGEKKSLSPLNSNLYELAYNLAKQKNTKLITADIYAKFLKLFNYPITIYQHLSFLNQSKLLSHIVPFFKHTVGLSQFDLFHRYSVDIHTLKVVQQASQLLNCQHSSSMTPADKVTQKIKPNILLLSAFFHDLGKGLGGKHELILLDPIKQYLSSLGNDAKTITNLVQHHLVMSQTAQKKDISEPYVIKDFCQIVKSKTTLDYLYLLTICDIRGTNLDLWNNWRFSLLTSLYEKAIVYFDHPYHTKAFTEKNNHNKIHTTGKINRLKNKHPHQALDNYLSLWSERYLAHFSVSSIQWHLDLLLDTLSQPGIQIYSRFNPRIKQAEIITYSKEKRLIFGPIASISTRLSLTILDARIYTAKSGETFSQYVIDHQYQTNYLNNQFNLDRITKQIHQVIIDDKPHKITKVRKRIPKSYILESTPEILIYQDKKERLIIEIHTLDYPGILADIIEVFDQFKLYITHAKINTLDQKIRDIFYLNIETFDQNQLDLNQLKIALIKATIIH